VADPHRGSQTDAFADVDRSAYAYLDTHTHCHAAGRDASPDSNLDSHTHMDTYPDRYG